MRTIENPIIPGYNPDPSICRAEDTYYLVTSSFEFFPGVPIYSSKNLTDWKLIGHCLTRKSQLPLEGCNVSGGVFAPSIRYHDGTFFMVTTNVSSGGNFIVHTKDPAGEWSEPALIRQGGIDPSLLFAEDKVYFISTSGCNEDDEGMHVCEIDPFTGEMLSDSRPVSRGCGGMAPEGPHLYYIRGWYYLLMAEGGTFYGHMVTLQRSRSVYGPYEPCPYNPIISNKNRIPNRNTISCTGHGDLVEDSNGNWWIVLLGVRILQSKNFRSRLHNLGRETFLAPVFWDQNGWCIAGDNGFLPLSMDAPLPGSPVKNPEGYVKAPVLQEDFKGERWNLEFTQIRNPDPALYRMNRKTGMLTLEGRDSLVTPCISPTFLGIRQNAFNQRVSVTVSAETDNETGLAGLSAYYHHEHHYDWGIGCRNGKKYLILRRQIYDLIKEEIICPFTQDCIRLVLSADTESYYFGYVKETGETVYPARGAAAALCSEITRRTTFTGTFIGMFAEHMTASFQNFVREML